MSVQVRARAPEPGQEGARSAVVGLLVEPRYRVQRQPAALVARLHRQGHQVRELDLDGAVRIGDPDWCRGIDVLLCRGRSAALLGLLAAAELAGVRCVNRPAAIAGVLNKAAMGVRLAAAGLPVPDTFIGTPDRIAVQAGGGFPLILKPVCGDNAAGLRIVWSRRELLELRWPEPLVLAQRFLAGAGDDLKVYVAGRRVWAVRRPSPIDQLSGGPVPAPSGASVSFPVNAELKKLALRCGDVFGLDLYGVDCLQAPAGPVVLEVNDFPNYSGLPETDDAIVSLLLGSVGRRRLDGVAT